MPLIRRALLALLAATASAGCVPQQLVRTITVVAPGLAAPEPEEPVLTLPGHYIVGASVTRLSIAAIRDRLPGVVIDAADGRSMIHASSHGAPTIMQVIRGWLPRLEEGDWLVVEAAHGQVEPEVNRRYMREVIRLLPDTVCLAWVIPNTHYGQRNPTTIAWNDATEAVIREELPAQRCHAFVEWRSFSEARWLNSGGQPITYDGRHPTTAGAWWYSKLIAEAVL